MSFRAGFKTTEFWVFLLASLGAYLASITTSFPDRYAVYISAVSFVAFGVSRAVQKYGQDLKRGYMTSEFWAGAITVALAGVAAWQDNLPNRYLALVIGVVAPLIPLIRGFAKPNPPSELRRLRAVGVSHNPFLGAAPDDLDEPDHDDRAVTDDLPEIRVTA